MSPSLDTLRLAGTVGLGLAAGMALGITTLTVPSIANARAPHERLHVWSKLYDLGKVQIPLLVVLSTVALGSAAYSDEAPVARLGFMGVPRGTMLVAAAGIALSIIPFTFAVMMPGIHRLKAIEQKAFASKDAAGSESERLLAAWNIQHAIRALLLTVAFSISAVELVAY